jgi:ubiquinone/menaquinone biosynthesis C-methylase UbiE
MRKQSQAYDPRAAEQYWSQRLGETSELAAVLSYDLPSYMNRAYSQWEIGIALRSLPPLEGLDVLDVGCGIGRLTVPLAQQKARVVSLDNSAAMLEKCRRNVEQARAGAFVRYQKGSAASLPFEPASFDAVACVGVLEHLPDDVRAKAVGEMIRVLRPAGSLVLVLNNAGSYFLRREERYRMQRQRRNGYFVALVERDSLVRQLADAGFAARPVGSNLFQSLVKHVGQSLGWLTPDSDLMEHVASASALLDLRYRLKGDLDDAFADQWVVVAERRAAAKPTPTVRMRRVGR